MSARVDGGACACGGKRERCDRACVFNVVCVSCRACALWPARRLCACGFETPPAPEAVCFLSLAPSLAFAFPGREHYYSRTHTRTAVRELCGARETDREEGLCCCLHSFEAPRDGCRGGRRRRRRHHHRDGQDHGAGLVRTGGARRRECVCVLPQQRASERRRSGAARARHLLWPPPRSPHAHTQHTDARGRSQGRARGRRRGARRAAAPDFQGARVPRRAEPARARCVCCLLRAVH